MNDEWSRLMLRIQALPDGELVRVLERGRDDYTDEALRVAEEEAAARGGLAHLKATATLTPSETARARRARRSAEGRRLAERLLSALLGRPPSDRYPGLSYVAIALRLAAFAVGTLVLASGVLGIRELFAGEPGAWLMTSAAFVKLTIGALLFYGGSELIHVVLDIERNTRERRPGGGAAPP